MGDGKLGENEEKYKWIGWWYTPVIFEIVLWTAENLFVVQMTALARINDRAIQKQFHDLGKLKQTLPSYTYKNGCED